MLSSKDESKLSWVKPGNLAVHLPSREIFEPAGYRPKSFSVESVDGKRYPLKDCERLTAEHFGNKPLTMNGCTILLVDGRLRVSDGKLIKFVPLPSVDTAAQSLSKAFRGSKVIEIDDWEMPA